MIEKKYGIARTLRCFSKKHISCRMQNKSTSDEKIILLINPLIIEGETNSYSLNNGSDFKEIKPLEFTLNSDKDVKQKLDKKKNKTAKDGNDVNENAKRKQEEKTR